MSDTITLGFNIFLGVFILFGIIWGLIRGLKKTASRGIFLLITGIILIFVTIPITKLFLNIEITTQIDNGESVTTTSLTIVEYISYLLKDWIGADFVKNNPEFANMLVSIPLLLINALMYTLLFWILKIILYPLNALINMLIFKRKRKKSDILGFASNNNEYNQSDESIESLRDVYNKTQIEKNSAGMFIKSDEDISKDAPTASADRVRIDKTQVSEPETKQEIKQKQKEEKKALKKAEKEASKSDKPKKYRLWGALVGAFVGVVVLFNTMVPVYGILNIMGTAKELEIKHLTNEPTSLSSLTNGLTDDIIKGYELSILGRISSSIGLEQLGLAGFDKLTSSQIGDEKVVLRDDISALTSTIKEVDNFIGLYEEATKEGLANISQENLTALITGIENIINKAEQIKSVSTMSDYIIPIASDYIVEHNVKIVENDNVNELIFNTLKDLSMNKELKVFDELKTIVDVVKYLDNQKLLIKVVNNDYSDMLTTIQNLDADFGTVFTNKIFALKTVSSVFPNILEIGLTFLDEATEFEYTENTATAEELKNSISTLLDTTIATAKTLSENSSIYLTDDSLAPLGKVLDTFRNSKLLNLDSYNSLVDLAVNNIKQMTVELVPDNFKDFFNNKLLRNISKVESWETEMTIIADSLKILRDKDYGILGIYDVITDSRIGYNVKIEMNEETFINIGKALDKLESSTLIGSDSAINHNSITYEGSSLVSLVNSLINELKSSIDDTDNTLLKDIKSVIDTMQTNLITEEHLSSSKSTFWQDEMTTISPLIIYVKNLSETENFEITDELGEILDTCTYNSVMLGNDTTLKLMATLISTIKDEVLGDDYTFADDGSLNDTIYTLLEDIEDNLGSQELYTIMKNDKEKDFWTTEIESLLALNNIANKADSISNISSALEIAEDLDRAYESKIIPVNSFNETIASVLRQLKTTDATGVEEEINNMIEEIATDISSDDFFDDKNKTNFWKIELGHISTLDSLQLTDTNDYKVKNHLSDIGNPLDSITKGYNFSLNTDKTALIQTPTATRPSYLITEERVRKLLATAITDVSSSITTSFEEGDLRDSIVSSLESICNNIYDDTKTTQVEIVSFEYELSHLQTLSKLDINSNLFTYTAHVEALNIALKTLGQQLDSIAYNTLTKTIIENTSGTDVEIAITSYNENLNSKIITRNILANIISSAFGTAKAEESNDNDSATKMYNSLITSIQDSILDTLSHIDPDNDQKTIPDKVIKWERELSYVTNLTQLNADTVFTLDNAVNDVAKHLDLIAFNTLDNNYTDIKYTDQNDIKGLYVDYIIDDTDLDHPITTYYNSVIITREILKNGVNNLLDTLNVSDEESSNLTNSQQEIVTELIDNLKTKVNTTSIISSSTLYTTYTEAFTDLIEVKDTMKEKADIVTGKNIGELNDSIVADIDLTLTDLQNRIISGVITTRKIALMIANEVNDSMTDIYAIAGVDYADYEAGKYTAELIQHYTENAESTTKEVYTSTDGTGSYINPFVTIKDKLIDL